MSPKAKSDTTADVVLKLAELIRDIKASSDEQAKQALSTQAELLIRTMPENRFPPLVSCYNPEGDRDHPRPQLKCQMFQLGLELQRDTLTVEEIELLNSLMPGNYRVTKANGDRIPFTVKGELDNGGKLQKLSIDFPCKGDDRYDHASLVRYLREAQGLVAPSVTQLEAQLAALQAELEAVKAGASAAA